MVHIELYGLIALIAGVTAAAATIGYLAARRSHPALEPPLTTGALDTAIARLQGELSARVGAVDDKFTNLSNLFVNDRTRGTWGELALRKVLEEAGLREGHDYELQATSASGRPDAVVHLPGERKLIIDAKFPLARLSEALAAGDDDLRSAQLKAHAAEIHKQAKGLVARGYHEQAAGGFVVMYLPHEALYSEAMAAMPSLYGSLLEMRVVLAGPSTLFALLSAAGHIITEQRVVTAARDIVDEARELRRRLGTFSDHLAKVGRGLNSAVGAFNGAIGSWQGRVLPQADKVAERAGLSALEAPAQVDAAPRVVETEPPTLSVAG